jgi:hypothetical protein
MNHRSPKRLHSAVILAGFLASLLEGHSARAASGTWDGGSISNAQWATPANWLGDPTPPGATTGTTNADVATFNAAIANGWTTIVIDAGRNIGGITFTGTSGNFIVGSTGGSALLLSSGGTTQITSGLTATNLVATVNSPLQIQGASGTYSLTNDSANGTGAGAGTLKIGGAVTGATAGATVVTLNGTNQNDNRLSGNISNGSATSLAISKPGTGSWTLGKQQLHRRDDDLRRGAAIGQLHRARRRHGDHERLATPAGHDRGCPELFEWSDAEQRDRLFLQRQWR